MPGNVALDTSSTIRYLNGDSNVVANVLAFPTIILPVVVTGELLFGAKNSARFRKNLDRYLAFIMACEIHPITLQTANIYADIRFKLKTKGRPIPENDIWIAAQCLENDWLLITDDHHFSYVDGLTVEQW